MQLLALNQLSVNVTSSSKLRPTPVNWACCYHEFIDPSLATGCWPSQERSALFLCSCQTACVGEEDHGHQSRLDGCVEACVMKLQYRLCWPCNRPRQYCGMFVSLTKHRVFRLDLQCVARALPTFFPGRRRAGTVGSHLTGCKQHKY